MSVTTERLPIPLPASARGSQRAPALLLIAVLWLVSGCAEEPLPERKLSRDDCLQDLRMDALDEALKRCERVVAAFPKDPVPLNERFLIHTLRGDTNKACQDIASASKLAAAIPAAKLDPLLRNDLRVRSQSCRD